MSLREFDLSRRRLVTALGVGGVTGLAGCTGGFGGASGGPELVATFSADVKNFDPTQINDTTSSKAFGLVYETLMGVDFDGKPQPVLATSVEQRDGDRNWRVTLRDGVSFHNGDSLTAADVKASFERYEGTPRESDVYLWYDSGTVVDDATFDFTLSKQFAPLKFSLSNVPIVPKAVADGELDLSENPVGTGPYAFDAHEPDNFFRITRNDDYWFEGSDTVPGEPQIQTVTFRIIVEQSGQLAALKAGDVDLINNPSATSIEGLKGDSSYSVTERTAGGFDMLMFPLATTPFDTKKVRKGVARLIPREDIVESVYDGIGEPAYAPISPLARQFTSDAFQQEMKEKHTGYDREKARSLLEAGFAEAGVSKPFDTKIISNENPERVKWAQLIAESLNETEFFNVTLEQFEWNTYTGKVLAKDSNQIDALMALGWSAGWDPDNYVRNLFHSNQLTPNCCNAPHYSNPKVDDLLDKGLQTYDLAERKEFYEAAQRQIVDDSPIAFIRFGKRLEAFDAERVEGFQTYPIDGGEFTAIYAPHANTHTTVSE